MAASDLADVEFMRRAIELARAGWGRVHPNPLVGAVVVRDGQAVGEGAHLEYGGPHAEIHALRAAGAAAAGATLYVTLEPCAHQGKTPPCTDAIVAAGIRRVVYAVADPDPVAGGGAAVLRAAGLEVRSHVEAERAREENALFLLPLERARPFVALKFGLSLDARIARRSGERTRLTGPESEAAVHRLRAGYDAILVGGRTARIDDPLLTARGSPSPRVPPVRVVASVGGDLPAGSRLLRTLDRAPVWVVAAEDAPADATGALERQGARVLPAAAGPDGLDVGAVVDVLAGEGIRTVFCEGGGRLAAALLRAERVDRLYLFHAPVVFGDAGVPAFPGRVAFRGRVVETRRLGADTLTMVDRSD